MFELIYQFLHSWQQPESQNHSEQLTCVCKKHFAGGIFGQATGRLLTDLLKTAMSCTFVFLPKYRILEDQLTLCAPGLAGLVLLADYED